MRADGGFVVVWEGRHYTNGWPTTDVLQRRFAADGTPLSGEFKLSDAGPNGFYFSDRPDVAVDDDDNFYVVWHTQLNLEWGGEYGRRTDESGATGPTKQHGFASYGHGFSMTASGEFVVGWEEYDCCSKGARFDPLGDEIGPITVPEDVFLYTIEHLSDDSSNFIAIRLVDPPAWNLVGQRFGGPLFIDGFESGDTNEWSVTVP